MPENTPSRGNPATPNDAVMGMPIRESENFILPFLRASFFRYSLLVERLLSEDNNRLQCLIKPIEFLSIDHVSRRQLTSDCVEKGHFLKNGFVIKIIFYLKQLFKNLAIGKNGLKTPKTDFFNRIVRYRSKSRETSHAR
jgi:hypothetical protein